MASSLETGGTRQFLRDLFVDGTAVGLGDGQLLSRYADTRDEAAFEVLVARHGPMVLATCRAVLRHETDVEDAFQATFLILAQRARSVRAGDALADWLHRVAYRVAVRAGTSSQRRRRREAEVSAMTTPVVNPSRPDPDVAAIVHGEVDRLPEKHRLPVVLCDLGGLTYEQAASRLRWTEPTLRTRLAKARQQLRVRLVRRGVTAVAMGAVLDSARSVTVAAAVPPAWARTAASAAAGKAAPAAVAALAAGFTRSLIATRVMIAAIAVFAIGSVGAIALGLGRPDPPAATPAHADAPRHELRALDPPGRVTVRGRVLAPDGQPVPGAKLYMTLAWGYPHVPSPSSEYATTRPDGRFQFDVPAAEFSDRYLVVAALAPGYGVGWVKAPVEGKRDDLTIRLVRDDVPINGQVIDLEGRPVAGVTVRLMQINAAPDEDLGPWLEAVRGKKGVRLDLEQQYLSRFTVAVPLNVTTDASGRFRLTGIGRNRLVTAQLDGPTVASQHIHMLTRPGTPIEAAEITGGMAANDPQRVVTYYGADFRHAAAPTRPIVGVVRDHDTGRPIAGVTIRSLALAVRPDYFLAFDLVRTTTDAQGRYRLTGMPRRAGCRIAVIPNDDQPYVRRFQEIPDRPGLDPVTADIDLRRGVWIEGRITDKRTGRPLRGAVEYFAMSSNPNLRDYPNFDGTFSFLDSGARAKEDGSYRVVGLPGPGLVAVIYLDNYLRATQRDDEYGARETSFDTAPYALTHPVNYAAIARIDPVRGAIAVQRDISIDPGLTFTGTVLRPNGVPLAGARRLTGLRWWDPEGMRTPEFTIQGLDPRKPAEVLFQHPKLGLIGVARPPKDNGGSVTVRMQPGGSVMGRLVDPAGRPRAGVELEVQFRIDDERPSGAWRNYSPWRILTTAEGRFRVAGLLPGYRYRLSDGSGVVLLDFSMPPLDFSMPPLDGSTPQPARAKELGDVRMTAAGDE